MDLEEEDELRARSLTFGIVTPPTVERASFEKNEPYVISPAPRYPRMKSLVLHVILGWVFCVAFKPR